MIEPRAFRKVASAPPQHRATQVLIVDDSVVVRRVMSRALAQDARFNVAGSVSNGALALEFVAKTPVDLVLLDVEMPGLNGLEVLAKLLSQAKRPEVVLLSGSFKEGSEIAVQALAAGANDVVAKPSAGHFSDHFIEHLLDRLIHLAPAVERSRSPEQADEEQARRRPLGSHVRAVAIGGSTGGISAIISILKGLEEAANFPIFVTQHLPASFQPLLVEQMRRCIGLPVVLAEHAMPVKPGTIYVAPGTGHLSLVKGARGHVLIRLTDEQCFHAKYPAVDPMFAALGAIYGQGACGVMLSGMGRDGLVGAQAIVAAEGWVIAQDYQSSAVWGMPGSVVKAGLASAIIPPDAIAGLILQQARTLL